jgi:hypothetical protein
MSSIGGPGIVRDGLVLYVDAANEKCFRGEPTENLFSTFSSNQNNAVLVGVSPIGLTCGGSANWDRCNYGGGTFVFNHVETMNPYGVKSLVGNLIVQVEGGDYRSNISNIGASTLNRTFTFSIWVKNNGGSDTSISMSIRTSGDTNGPTIAKTITTEWQRLSITHTFTGSCDSQIRSYLFGLNTGMNILLYGAQLEEKSYPTPFINGTRGTTVATGGGLIDLSKNGSNGELINGVTYNSSNGGNLVFDGVDDYCKTSDNQKININDNFTVSIWVKSTEWTANNQEGLISKGTLNNWVTYLRGNNGTVSFYTSGSDFWDPGPNIGGNNNWCNITFIYSYSNLGYKQVYYNGLFYAQKSITIPINNNTDNLEVGFSNSVGLPKYLKGQMSTILYYNKVLSAQEILQNYNATKSRFGL